MLKVTRRRERRRQYVVRHDMDLVSLAAPERATQPAKHHESTPLFSLSLSSTSCLVSRAPRALFVPRSSMRPCCRPFHRRELFIVERRSFPQKTAEKQKKKKKNILRFLPPPASTNPLLRYRMAISRFGGLNQLQKLHKGTDKKSPVDDDDAEDHLRVAPRQSGGEPRATEGGGAPEERVQTARGTPWRP